MPTRFKVFAIAAALAAGTSSAAMAQYACAPGYTYINGVCQPARAPGYGNPVTGTVSGEAAGASSGYAAGGPVGAVVGGAAAAAAGAGRSRGIGIPAAGALSATATVRSPPASACAPCNRDATCAS